jgi:hypothetical protein
MWLSIYSQIYGSRNLAMDSYGFLRTSCSCPNHVLCLSKHHLMLKNHFEQYSCNSVHFIPFEKKIKVLFTSGGETHSIYNKGLCDKACQWLSAGQLFSPGSGKKTSKV